MMPDLGVRRHLGSRNRESRASPTQSAAAALGNPDEASYAARVKPSSESTEPAAPSTESRKRGADPTPTWRFAVALVVVAVVGALFAHGFRLLAMHALRALYGHGNVVDAFVSLPWVARIAAPAAFGYLAGHAAERARRLVGGQNVGDVMEAVVLGGTRMRIGATLWRSVGCFIAQIGGASIGREGPLIQFGAAFGEQAAAIFRVDERHRRALLSAGTAAGFAAAYNTPIAAVLFVVEVITGVMAAEAIVPTIVAVAIATTVSRGMSGAGPIYGARAFHLASTAEMGLHAVIGLFAGLIGLLFVRALAHAEDAFRRIPTVPLRTLVGGAGAGLVASVCPMVVGNGYEPLNALLDGHETLAFVLLLLVGKVVATLSSVGSGTPGGIFTPSMFVGAAFGAVSGHLAHLGLDGIVPVGSEGSYALVGMAAVVAATTHAPLMATVLVFELSGDYAIVLPLLLATAIASRTARFFHTDSVYGAELRRRGVVWNVTLEGRQVEHVGGRWNEPGVVSDDVRGSRGDRQR